MRHQQRISRPNMGSYNHLLSRGFPSTLENLYNSHHLCIGGLSSKCNFRVQSNYDAPKSKNKNSGIFIDNASIMSRNLMKVLVGRAPKFSTSTKSWERGNDKEDEERSATRVSLIDVYLPESIRPYAHLARVDMLSGSVLTAWPVLWSIAFAANPGQLPDMKMVALFAFLSWLTHCIGCTINDYLDRDIDRKVKRTQSRPLASGALTPSQGLWFLGFQILLGYGLLLPVNNLSRLLWVSSMPIVFVYPLMKRITYWPSAFLGFALGYGALYGWSAVEGSLNPSIVFPIILAVVFWTLIYDTIYAHQDKEDDLKAGVKSTALLLGDATKESLTFFGITSTCSLALAGYSANTGWPYYAFLFAALAHFIWQIWTVDLSNPDDCKKKFLSNKFLGAVIFTGIVLGRIFP